MRSEKAEILEILLVGGLLVIVLIMLVMVINSIKYEIDFGVKEGIIIDKEHSPAYKTFVYSGKVLVPVHHAEKWQLKIEKESKELWVNVDKKTYHNYQIGEFYSELKEE